MIMNDVGGNSCGLLYGMILAFTFGSLKNVKTAVTNV
jgi:hypothetical protein